MNNIGIVLVTCNRPAFFEKSIAALPKADKMIVINDGKKISERLVPTYFDNFIQHKKNIGVGRTKNEGLRFLLENGCEHIFVCEDDIMVKNSNIYNKYIEAANNSGIRHLNFAYHGNGNKSKEGNPIHRKIVFDDQKKPILTLNKNLLGAFTYFNRKILHEVGLIDELFYNAWEHVDHTYQIIKACMHPPFWWFADIFNSSELIEDLDSNHSHSIIRQQHLSWKFNLWRNTRKFKLKNGIAPYFIPDSNESFVENELQRIKSQYAQYNNI